MYKICAQQAPAAMYSASAVDKAILFCFLDDQDTKDLPSKWHPPDVLFSINFATGIIRVEIAN
jgi:hypothetical protein